MNFCPSAIPGPRKMRFGWSPLEKQTALKGIATIMAIVRYERKPGDPLTRLQKENLKRIAEIKDEDIDLSDIPELTDEWFARAVRGKFYRPVKEIVSIRLDKDVLAFYRS